MFVFLLISQIESARVGLCGRYMPVWQVYASVMGKAYVGRTHKNIAKINR